VIPQDKKRSNVIHDLDGSEMGEWEGPNIPLDEFDEVRKMRIEKPEGYDLWLILAHSRRTLHSGSCWKSHPWSVKLLRSGCQ
jgi:hypothetical protein